MWNFYVGLLFYGLITVLSEWRHIDAAPVQKLGYVLTFPIFMFTYIPISIAALVQKVEWKPIYTPPLRKSTSWDKQRGAADTPGPPLFLSI